MAKVISPERPTASLPAVLIPERGFKRLEKSLTVVITVLPLLGVITSVPLLWNRGITAVDLVVMLVSYLVTGLGISVGFHRYFTHRSFKAKQWVRGALAIAGSFAVEGAVIKWVADHRRHHAFSDRPGDPHSPHLAEDDGVVGVLKGLWHAHIGWFFDVESTNKEKFTPDLLRDPLIRKIDSLTPLWIVLSFAVPALIGLLVTGTLFGAVTAFIWGSLVRVFLVHHITWSINSICHYFGKRPFESTDESVNNWPLALISFGEAWHNNHHAFPSSAAHGLEKGQFDMGWGLIRLLEKRGLIYDVKRPSPEDLEKKRIS